MDQSSFWTVDATGPPRKLCRPTMASPEPGGMLRFLRFQGFIRGMSVKLLFAPAAVNEPSQIRACELMDPTP